MSESAIQVTCSILVIIVFFLCFCNADSEEKGALYFNEGGKSVFVCDGILETIRGYSTKYKFICDDGKVITSLTNFTFKAVEK